MNALLSPTAESNLLTMGIASEKDERQEVPAKPTIPPIGVRVLRAQLCGEEAFFELCKALGLTIRIKDGRRFYDIHDFIIEPSESTPDLDAIIDACCDGIYVLIGTLMACGVADKPHLKEVCDCNNAKFPGGVGVTNENGKYQKPPGWEGPNHKKVREKYLHLDMILSQKVIISEVRDRAKIDEVETGFGRLAYESYCSQSENKSLVTGDKLPDWRQLPLKVKLAWHAAANSVSTRVMVNMTLPTQEGLKKACEGEVS